MNRSKIILAAVLVVLFAAVGVSGYNVYGKSLKAKKVRKARDNAKVELEKVFKDEIFPSAENVEALKGNVEKLSTARDEIAARLAACNFNAPTNVSPSAFVDTLRNVVLKKRDAAPVIEGKKSVGADFTFGFERYLGASAAMPRDTDVPRLLEQLVITTSLVDEMFASGITTVKSIRREMFDGAGEAVAEDEESGGRRGRRRGRGGDDEEEKAEQETVGPGYSIDTDLYRAQHFTLQLVARQNAVIDLLNRVAKLHMGSQEFFAVVTDIKLQKAMSDIRLPGGGNVNEEKESRGGRRGSRAAKDEEEEAPAEVVAAPTISDLPPSQRLMSGPELDSPLDVTIELDVYSFKKGAQ